MNGPSPHQPRRTAWEVKREFGQIVAPNYTIDELIRLSLMATALAPKEAA